MREHNKHRRARLLAGMIKAVAEFRGVHVHMIDAEIGRVVGCSAATIERMKSDIVWVDDPKVVKGLATFGVREGLFGAAWLRDFLTSAKYAEPEAVIEELIADGLRTPALQAAPLPPWCDNLPAAPFSGAVVARRELIRELLEALEAMPVVVLLGLGGMGKTTLAHHIAIVCRDQRSGASAATSYKLPGPLPAVQAAVWVSDSARHGETTLDRLLDSVARTFDYPGIAARPPAEKEAAVRALLAATPTLLIIDNAETVVDPDLIPWLLDLPPRTQVLITSRQMVDAFTSERVRVVRVEGMTEAESRRLVREHARSLGYAHLNDESQRMLLQRTGSCPQALKQIVGYAARLYQPLDAVAVKFDALAGDLLADLFERCWETVLSDDARALLVVLSCFDDPVIREGLAATAALEPNRLDAAIQQLGDLSLVILHSAPDQPGVVRYGLHPLTRSFVRTRHATYKELLDAADGRRIAWAAGCADTFGYRVENLALLSRLETDEPMLRRALDDAAERREHEAVIRLAKGIEFYYYIKCRWDDKLALHQRYIAAAEALGNEPELVTAITMHIQLLCRLWRPQEAEPYLNLLVPLAERASGQEQFHVRHARALYHHTSGSYRQAQVEWQAIDTNADDWGLPDHMRIGALHWLGLNFAAMGEVDLARAAFQSSRQLAQRAPQPIHRWIARNQIQLALIDLAKKDVGRARARLEESRELLAQADREQLAYLRWAEARLLQADGNRSEADAANEEARSLFARMGLPYGPFKRRSSQPNSVDPAAESV